MPGLRQLLERPEPTIAVPFASSAEVLRVDEVVDDADVAELRADYFPDGDDVLAAVTALRKHMPVILTARHTDEAGGKGGMSDNAERMKLYEAHIDRVDGVDVEVRSAICHDVVDVVHASGGLAIGSFHSFGAMPEWSQLLAVLEAAREAEVDYVKYALTMRSDEEYKRTLGFLVTHAAEGLIVVGMDDPLANPATDFGPRSRTVFPVTGSRLTYASLGASVAPGQLDVHEQANRFRKLGYDR